MKIEDYIQEKNFQDERAITRGQLVRLFDLIRAQAKLDARHHAWDATEAGTRS